MISRTTPNARELNVRRLLATNLPLRPRCLQLPVALRVDLLLPPSQPGQLTGY